MSILTKLHVNQEQLNILHYRLSVLQDADYTGRPSAKPVVQPLEFTYETIKNDPFYNKMISGKMSDTLKLVITPVQGNSKTTTIEILDYYVLEHRENFDGVNDKPMTTYVKISFATLIVNNQVMDIKYWKQSDPNLNTVATTQTEQTKNQEEETGFLVDLEMSH